MARPLAPQRAVERAVDAGLIAPGERVVVAVSGGADSVFLLLTLYDLAPARDVDLHVAHLDHGWRGDPGAADADWVAALAERLGLPCHRERVDAPATAREARESPEEAARRLRYAFLRNAAFAAGATAVATGHTADDQVETILLALLRGGGPASLGGMRPATPLPAPASAPLRVVRPMLEVSGEDVRRALRAAGQAWREDATNRDLSLPRNRLRLEVLPALERVAPGFRAGVRRAGGLAAGAAGVLRREAERAGADLFRAQGAGLAAPRPAFLALPPVVQGEVLRWAVAELRAAAPEPVALGPASSAPEWAHIQGALTTVERGRGGAQAWLAPDVRLRLWHGRVVVERAAGSRAHT